MLIHWRNQGDVSKEEKDGGPSAYLLKGPRGLSLKIQRLGVLCSTASEDRKMTRTCIGNKKYSHNEKKNSDQASSKPVRSPCSRGQILLLKVFLGGGGEKADTAGRLIYLTARRNIYSPSTQVPWSIDSWHFILAKKKELTRGRAQKTFSSPPWHKFLSSLNATQEGMEPVPLLISFILNQIRTFNVPEICNTTGNQHKVTATKQWC